MALFARLYRRPGAAEALLALQDEAGLDIKLILYALWVGLSGRGALDEHALRAARQAVAEIDSEVIEPLRALRRRIRTSSDPDILRLRDRVKRIELDAEQTALYRLAALAGPRAESGSGGYLGNAEANARLYLGAAANSRPQAAALFALLKKAAAHTRHPLTPPRTARPSV